MIALNLRGEQPLAFALGEAATAAHWSSVAARAAQRRPSERRKRMIQLPPCDAPRAMLSTLGQNRPSWFVRRRTHGSPNENTDHCGSQNGDSGERGTFHCGGQFSSICRISFNRARQYSRYKTLKMFNMAAPVVVPATASNHSFVSGRCHHLGKLLREGHNLAAGVPGQKRRTDAACASYKSGI